MKKLVFIFSVAALTAFLTLSQKTPIEMSAAISPMVNQQAKEARVSSKLLSITEPEVLRFYNETVLILERLPTNQATQETDSHHAPKELMDASEDLGNVLSTMKNNATLVPTGIEFYKACALKSDILEQLRALCLRNFQDWSKKNGISINPDVFPSRIKQLASLTPKTFF